MTTFRFEKWGPAPATAVPPWDIIKQKKLSAAVIGLAFWAAAADAQDIPVPSGLPITLYDVRIEQETAIARFRFVSAAIDPTGAGKTFADVVDDLQYLCDKVAVPSLAANSWAGGEVILSVSNVETVFGETAPEVTQFFQPYQIVDQSCIWGEF